MAGHKSPLGFTVFRGFAENGCYVSSPFVTKLEARLRFGNISYHTEPGSLSKAPRGKVPYVSIDRGDGNCETLSDSTLIAHALIESGDVEDLNGNLAASLKLQDLSIRALLEDKLYFYQVQDTSC
jgi:glutathione S-transferase